jgi:hypothetical protein
MDDSHGVGVLGAQDARPVGGDPLLDGDRVGGAPALPVRGGQVRLGGQGVGVLGPRIRAESAATRSSQKRSDKPLP